MKFDSHGPLLVWLGTAVCVGIGSSLVPWGTSTGFHGTGFPFFIVAWDRSATTGQMIDFINPLAYLLNPLIVFIAGLVLWFLCRLAHALVRHCSPD